MGAVTAELVEVLFVAIAAVISGIVLLLYPEARALRFFPPPLRRRHKLVGVLVIVCGIVIALDAIARAR